MGHPEAESFHGPEDGGRRRRATGRNRDRVLELRALIGWRVSEHAQYNRRTAEVRDPMLGDQPEDLSGLDLAKTYLRSASGDNGPGIGPAGAVKHRQCPKVDAVKGKPEAEAVPECRQVGATMTIDDAPPVTGGSARTEQA